MLKIVDATNNISDFFHDDCFSIEQWSKYMDTVLPLHKNIFIDDMQNAIRTGGLTFENDYLSVLNKALINKESRARAVSSFRKVTDNLEEKIRNTMGNSIDATVILYMGLCNGAGWVIQLNSCQYVLLGIEKILELGWCDTNNMYGLIYHELGHIYQMQYGQLTKNYKNSDAFLWQLFTEGIAMLFEQKLIGNNDYFHQDKNGWADWCAANLNIIMNDFNADLIYMTRDNQRYFGDWVNYNNHNDVGYYLGAKFAQWINIKYRFEEMLNFDIKTVRSEWMSYLDWNNSGR